MLQRTPGNRAVQALITPGAPTAQRMPSASGLKGAVGLGKKPSPTQKAGKLADKAGTAKVATAADLEKQLARLEAATRKLKAGHIKAGQKAVKAGRKASDTHDKPTQDAAFLVKVAGQQLFDQLDDPDQKSRGSSLASAEQKKRLRMVIDENQLIYDEARVEKTKREAGDIYVKSGRASNPGGQAGKGGFTHLTPNAKSEGYDELGPRPAVNAQSLAWMASKGLTDYDDAVRQSKTEKYVKDLSSFKNMQPELYNHVNTKHRRDEAAKLGLTPAEFAAILTFTTEDFEYINPATANDLEFMVNKNSRAFADPLTDRKKKFLELQGEGSLHAGMAMQGLLKMPVFEGKLYRGEQLLPKAFDEKFVRSANGDVKAKVTTFSRNTITSLSKNPDLPWRFMGDGLTRERVFWEFDVIDGRDIEKLAYTWTEREVVVLPGSQFAITSVEAADLRGKKYWLVKAKQTR